MVQSVSFYELVFQDWSANAYSVKSRYVLVFFRLTQALVGCPGIIILLLGNICIALYTVIVQWILGIELPKCAMVGKGLQLFHGVGLVVHPASVIGEACILRHCTTLGSKGIDRFGNQLAPVLGDRVDVGCNVVIIGHVFVGNDAVIGAGSVVVHDVPEQAVVCGNPAKVVGFRNSNDKSKVLAPSILGSCT